MDRYSFYYRDTLDLKTFYPNAVKFSLLYSDNNLVIEDGIIRLLNPDAFLPSHIHNIVRVYPNKYDYYKILVSIRCWRNDEFRLKEMTKFRTLKSNRLYHFLRRAINKFFNLPINVHLLTIDGVSYFSYNNHLIRVKDGKKNVVGKIPQIADPIYFELLLFEQEAFFRTGNRIYMSTNCLTKWNVIYEGKRAIKNSMVWIERERALLFSEYTPGLNQSRHHLYKFFVDTRKTQTVMTFFTPNEYEEKGLFPYCRHIHTLVRDPFTNDIYMGVGDSDNESAIYRSTDDGNSFALVGGGNQTWRTLAFLFTKDAIFWNTDSPDPQYLSGIRRTQLGTLPVQANEVYHWPIYNSAAWNVEYDGINNLNVMSSSCEGALFDNKMHVLGIRIFDNIPIVYNLYEEEVKKASRAHQLFLLGIDNKGVYWFYDTHRKYYRCFESCNDY